MPGPSFTERYVIARDSNVLRATSRVGWGWCSIVLPAPSLFLPASGEGRGTGLGDSPERGWARPQSDFDALAIYVRPVRHGQERRKRPCGLPCFRSRSSSPSA
jgi:hypothetical protein